MAGSVEDSQTHAIEEIEQISTSNNQVKGEQKPQRKQTEEIEAKIGFENIEAAMSTRYLLTGFRIAGIYMPKTHKTLYIIWSFFINMIITIYVPIGFIITLVVMPADEVARDKLMTSFQTLLNALGNSAKFILMGFLLPKLVSCEPILKKLDNRCSSQEELMSIKALIKLGNRCVVLFTTLYWTYSYISCINAALLHELPFNIYNPLIDARASNFHFFLAWLMEVLVGKVVCFQQMVDDAYGVIYINILRTHLDILMKRISKLNTNTEQSLEANLEELKLCIIDHKNIIEIYERIHPIISATNFVQFVNTAIVMGTTLVNIMLFASDIASIVTLGLYVLAIAAEIFPLCYYAHCLMDESDRLSDVIFHSNWVDQNRSYRKLMIFFLQRSQRTFQFTAGKLFPITLNCFLSIAKFSFSLYTFVEEMGLKEKFAK